MDFNITLGYPFWYVLLCLLSAIVMAAVLYYRTPQSVFTVSQKVALFLLRFLAVFFIALLLLEPVLKRVTYDIQKPLVLLLHDNSSSIREAYTGVDSARYHADWKALKNTLSQKFEVREYSFSDELDNEFRLDYRGLTTNISRALRASVEGLADANLGAIVLASDGIYNEGSNPAYLSESVMVPVYTIGLGDTTSKKDIILEKAVAPRIVYLDDRFELRTEVSREVLSGKGSEVSVYLVEEGNNRLLEKQILSFSDGDSYAENSFILTADRAGLSKYRVVVESKESEYTLSNNRKEVFIEVLDARQQILLLAASPHPDLAAISEALSSSKNYEVEVAYAASFNSSRIKEYDLVIAHRLPAVQQNAATIFTAIQESKTPVWFICGDITDYAYLSSLQNIVSVKVNKGNTVESKGLLNSDFSLHSTADLKADVFAGFPPLLSPMGDIKTELRNGVLFYQKIGNVKTEYPLWIEGEINERKTVVLLGEGLWKWRLHDFLRNKNHELFNRLVQQTVQYLSVKTDRRPFRVTLDKKVYKTSEDVSFRAELYNDSYELINEPDVSLTITSDDGKEYPFLMGRRGNAYTYDVKRLPPGEYRYKATTSLGGKSFTANGVFTLTEVNLEQLSSKADHSSLRSLSLATGGSFHLPDQLLQLSQTLSDNESMKPVYFDTISTKPLIDYTLILFVLIALLALEWFIRKYLGGY